MVWKLATPPEESVFLGYLYHFSSRTFIDTNILADYVLSISAFLNIDSAWCCSTPTTVARFGVMKMCGHAGSQSATQFRFSSRSKRFDAHTTNVFSAFWCYCTLVTMQSCCLLPFLILLFSR